VSRGRFQPQQMGWHHSLRTWVPRSARGQADKRLGLWYSRQFRWFGTPNSTHRRQMVSDFGTPYAPIAVAATRTLPITYTEDRYRTLVPPRGLRAPPAYRTHAVRRFWPRHVARLGLWYPQRSAEATAVEPSGAGSGHFRCPAPSENPGTTHVRKVIHRKRSDFGTPRQMTAESLTTGFGLWNPESSDVGTPKYWLSTGLWYPLLIIESNTLLIAGGSKVRTCFSSVWTT
jgi:hypothetical protein